VYAGQLQQATVTQLDRSQWTN